MLFKLILLFTVVSLLDLAILVRIGNYIGFAYTIAFIIITGVLGAYFAKKEGRNVINKIKFDISQGRMPADELIGGLCVLLGGVFLVAPGFITDAIGLILVLPISRNYFIHMAKEKFKDLLTSGSLWMYFRK